MGNVEALGVAIIRPFILSGSVALRGFRGNVQPGEFAGSISTAAYDGPLLAKRARESRSSARS